MSQVKQWTINGYTSYNYIVQPITFTQRQN
jgi:hypothetical protein